MIFPWLHVPCVHLCTFIPYGASYLSGDCTNFSFFGCCFFSFVFHLPIYTYIKFCQILTSINNIDRQTGSSSRVLADVQLGYGVLFVCC